MCEYVEKLIDILNNASVAAFMGAFFAFFLVALTDWRRKHNKKNLLVTRVKILKEIAQAKLETAEVNIKLIQNDQFTSAPVMKFPSDLGTLQREAFDVLNSTQINAVDALIYWMEAVDGIFESARLIAEDLYDIIKKGATTAERNQKGKELLQEFWHAKTNLEHFITLASMYIDNEPEKILEYRVKQGVEVNRPAELT